jgi:predicted RNA-binding protein with TRAM domain
MDNRNSSGKTSNYTRPVVQSGEEYTVDITDTGRAGDGIARIQGFVIFVKNAKAGDKNVIIKINSVGSRFANAIVIPKIRIKYNG